MLVFNVLLDSPLFCSAERQDEAGALNRWIIWSNKLDLSPYNAVNHFIDNLKGKYWTISQISVFVSQILEEVFTNVLVCHLWTWLQASMLHIMALCIMLSVFLWSCILVRALEKARSSAQLQANYSSSDNSLYTNPKGSTISAFDGGSDSSSESELEEPQSRKKLRMEAS